MKMGLNFTSVTALCATVLLMVSSISYSLGQERQEEYSRAIGGRFGAANGITYKHFLNNTGHAIDGILNFQGNSKYGLFKLVGLYEFHDRVAIADYEGLLWYYGGGGGLGFYTDKETDATDLAFSVDGVIGLDFKIPTAPVNISLDWKPTFELSPHPGMKFDGFGLSVRFVF